MYELYRYQDMNVVWMILLRLYSSWIELCRASMKGAYIDTGTSSRDVWNRAKDLVIWTIVSRNHGAIKVPDPDLHLGAEIPPQ